MRRTVIVISAALPKKGLRPEHESAVYAVMPKPFDLEGLRAIIRSCVEGGTAEQAG